MTIRDTVEIAGFVIVAGGIVYHAGRTAEQFKQLSSQSRKWADGLGDLFRSNNKRQERRWMLQLADDVEVAETQEKRSRIATRIREEVWRA